MTTRRLARIAYASATRDVTRAQLDDLLAMWRPQNAARAVTGFLLFHRESVFQVLEGTPDVIQALYSVIAHDRRHHFVAKLIDEPIEERGFGDWPMGYARVVHSDLAAIGTLRPFLDPAFCYWHCDAAMARDLLGAFSAGPWRRAIS
jgi:hypothetical protein